MSRCVNLHFVEQFGVLSGEWFDLHVLMLRAVQVKDPSENCWGWFNPPPGAESLPKKQACGDYQLFDLSKDPYEKNDLSGKKTSKVNELKEL